MLFSSFLPVIILNTLKSTSSVLFRTYILSHLSRLILDSDAVPESIHQDLCQKIKGLFIHGSIFNNLHFVGNDPLKLNNAI